ncbi:MULTISPECIES: hypothetical protein [Streptomyces]|uniref:hypothetical protein n=1 Tax=Streptomyces TaxID=1883 RepID=UPI001F5FE12F|nr:hypothetical protein [Streptomyces kasugaensis]
MEASAGRDRRLYLVGLPSYRDREDGVVEAAKYRVLVRAPKHVRLIDGIGYDQAATDAGREGDGT